MRTPAGHFGSLSYRRSVFFVYSVLLVFFTIIRHVLFKNGNKNWLITCKGIFCNDIFKDQFLSRKNNKETCVLEETPTPKAKYKSFPQSAAHVVGNDSFKLSGKISRFGFVFLSISLIIYQYSVPIHFDLLILGEGN